MTLSDEMKIYFLLVVHFLNFLLNGHDGPPCLDVASSEKNLSLKVCNLKFFFFFCKYAFCWSFVFCFITLDRSDLLVSLLGCSRRT